MRLGGIKSQSVDSVLIGIDRRKTCLRQQVGTQHLAGHICGHLVRVNAPAGSRDLKIHPPQPSTALEATNRFFLLFRVPQPQNFFHGQPQTDDILPIYARLFQCVGQQLGESVNTAFIQQHFFSLLWQGQFFLVHEINLLPYLIIP